MLLTLLDQSPEGEDEFVHLVPCDVLRELFVVQYVAQLVEEGWRRSHLSASFPSPAASARPRHRARCRRQGSHGVRKRQGVYDLRYNER